jgi:hypothetical protein
MRRLQSTRRSSAIAVAFFLVASTAVAPHSVHACPPPPTLVDHVRDSDAIVIGRVVAVQPHGRTRGNSSWVDYLVDLRVDTVLAGSARLPPALEVRTYADPIHHTDDAAASDRVLAFMFYDREQGRFLAYEVRPLPDLATERVLVARVREMLDIVKITDEAAFTRELLEWCIRCIEEPATREDGVLSLPYEVRREASGEDEDADAVTLSDSHRERILAAFLTVSSLDEPGANALAFLVADWPDSRAVAQLERHLWQNVDSPDAVSAPMYILSEMLGWKSGKELVGRYHQTENADEKQAVLTEYLSLLPGRVELSDDVEQSDENESVEETAEEVEEEVAEEPEEEVEEEVAEETAGDDVVEELEPE